jgi:hypothetical protein
VYISDHPLGPYTYAPNNPISYKPGGFINGAGHGSTVIGPDSTYWHFGSMAVSINVNWERRLCMFPTFFDKDGLMHSDTYFGDYPHYAPAIGGKKGTFRGWMLLSYKKPVRTSSSVGASTGGNAVDEKVNTFWLAEKNDDQQWLEVDLGAPSLVNAVQVNFHDHKSGMYGKIMGLRHRYAIEGSSDGRTWKVLADRRNSYKDVPNDYVELSSPQTVRYIRYVNVNVPTPHLAISGLRVFGQGSGKAPAVVRNFSVNRYADRRDAMITWDPVPGAHGYNILWGIAPDKLYSSWMVYDAKQLLMKSLTTDQSYYFAIEAFNENGISTRTKPVRIQ